MFPVIKHSKQQRKKNCFLEQLLRITVPFMSCHYTKTFVHLLIIAAVSNFSVLNFFFYQGFLSRTLTTHRTAGEGRGPSYSTLQIPPAH